MKGITTQKNSVLPILTETLPKKPRKIPIPSEKIFKKTPKKYIAHTREDRILDIWFFKWIWLLGCCYIIAQTCSVLSDNSYFNNGILKKVIENPLERSLTELVIWVIYRKINFRKISMFKLFAHAYSVRFLFFPFLNFNTE